MDIEVDTTNKSLCGDLFGNPRSITQGMTAPLPTGGRIQLESWHFYKADGIPDTLELLLSFPIGIASSLVANWLWTKFDGRVTRVRINKVDVQITEIEIRRVVIEQLELEQNEMTKPPGAANPFKQLVLGNYAIACGTWLQRRVEDAEAKDPQLRPMKDEINRITSWLTIRSVLPMHIIICCSNG